MFWSIIKAIPIVIGVIREVVKLIKDIKGDPKELKEGLREARKTGNMEKLNKVYKGGQ
jgi:hypothetical protein